MFSTLIYKDIIQAYRRQSDSVLSILFYATALILFPLILGHDTKILQHYAPAFIWLLIIFALCLSFNNIWQHDSDCYLLYDYYVSGNGFMIVIIAKFIAYFIIYNVPLLLMTPFVALIFHAQYIGVLLLSLMLGCIALSILGVFSAALTLQARNPSLLIMIITFPLAIPIVILGTSVHYALLDNIDNVMTNLMLLSAYSLFLAIFGGIFAHLSLYSQFKA